MRLKAIPEDFVVREATDLRIRKQPSPFRVYMLEKKGWNTADALVRIAKEKRVPYSRFAYGGKKDRHAHTLQYVTVAQTPADLSLEAKGYSLKLLGFAAEPMGPNHILANHFAITVRELSEAEVGQLGPGVARVKERGVPNYFDDQRFGNLDKERGYIAEKMLQGRWEEALSLALTAIHPEEHKEAKERKRAMREAWGDWEACRGLARTAFEQRSFDLLKVNGAAFKDALATAPSESLNMWLSTYQSFLWNEMLRRYLAEKGWAGPSVPGAAGDYIFPTEEARLHADLIIPLPGRGMRFPIPETALILEEILRERRLRPASLDSELLPGLGLKGSPRPVLVVPQSFWADPPEPDELYPGRQKAVIRFSLGRGSYATMVVKGIFA